MRPTGHSLRRISSMHLLCTPGTRVFVATGYIQRHEGAALMRELEKQHGLVITCDWTKETLAPLTMSQKAIRDTSAVRSAHVLVALMTLPSYEYKGTFTELGMALGLGIPIVLISPFTVTTDAKCARNIYFHCPEFKRYTSLADFRAALSTNPAS